MGIWGRMLIITDNWDAFPGYLLNSYRLGVDPVLRITRAVPCSQLQSVSYLG